MNLRFIVANMLVVLLSSLAMAQQEGICFDIGDVNQDGDINFDDIPDFCDSLLGVFQCEADANEDGDVNFLDVAPFTNILISQQNSFFQSGSSASPSNFFWSDKPLNQGALNQTLNLNVPVGGSRTVYLYYTTNLTGPGFADIDTGVALNVATSASGFVKFIAAQSHNYDITIGGMPVGGTRWNAAPDEFATFLPASSVADDLIIGLTAFNFCPDAGGMVFANTQAPFGDTGYDATADAFLFGSVEVMGVTTGTVNLIAGPNDLGILNVPGPTTQSFGEIDVTAVLLGDVDLNGTTNLLDVGPFIDRLSNGPYQAEADCNLDGMVNLIDVSFFIDIISTP